MKKYVLILGLVVSYNVNAEIIAQGDDCGDNCHWELSDNGSLLISGSGKMSNFAVHDPEENGNWQTTAPWGIYFRDIEKVVISGSISSIGDSAFYNSSVQDVSLPLSIEEIKHGAFQGARQLKNINLPENLKIIEEISFNSTESLAVIEIPQSVTEIENGAFSQTPQRTDRYVILNDHQTIGQNAFGHEFTGKVFCPNDEICSAAIEANSELSDKIQLYTKENGFYQIGDKLYATADLMTHNAACDDAANCQAILDAASQGKPFEVGGKYYATLDLFANGAACTDKQNCEDILSSNGNPFKVGSKIYNSMEDFAQGNNVKFRIYTIDEANAVAGTKNRVSIKYR